MEQHVLDCHTSLSKDYCRKCTTWYLSKSSLRSHIGHHHQGQRPIELMGGSGRTWILKDRHFKVLKTEEFAVGHNNHPKASSQIEEVVRTSLMSGQRTKVTTAKTSSAKSVGAENPSRTLVTRQQQKTLIPELNFPFQSQLSPPNLGTVQASVLGPCPGVNLQPLGPGKQDRKSFKCLHPQLTVPQRLTLQAPKKTRPLLLYPGHHLLLPPFMNTLQMTTHRTCRDSHRSYHR